MFKQAANSGAIIGGIGLIALLILLAFEPGMWGQVVVGIANFATFIVLLVIFTQRYRKSIGGYITYGKAFLFMLYMSMVAAFITSMFNLIYGNLIDPEYPARLMEQTWEAQLPYLESLSEEQLDEIYYQTEQRIHGQFSPFGIALGYVFALVFSSVLALIIAAFVKKKAPVHVQEEVDENEQFQG